MYKTLGIAVVLLAAFAFMSDSRSADASPVTPISPPIIARAKLPNQTAAIPTTTIFTPTQDGLYRLSVYMTQVVAVPSSSANWNFNVYWSDDAGQEQAVSMVFLPVNQSPPSAFGTLSGGSPGNTLVLEMKAGQALSYSTSLLGGTDSGTYSLYYTLERLE